jgi:23S rRNA pseudouridine1911/1915/1917 synthase
VDLKESFPITVASSEGGLRLDKLLSSRFPHVSRSRWSKLLDAGVLLIDQKPAKSSSKLREGQVISVQENKTSEFSEKRTLNILTSDEISQVHYTGPAPTILYEDEDLLVLDKPVGVAVHPGAGIGLAETIVAWLIEGAHIDFAASEELLRWGDDVMEQERPGIVHRLDKGTSGCLAIAKHPEAHRRLAMQFASKEAGRHYWACVHGDVTQMILKTPRKLQKVLDENRRHIAFRISKDGVYSFSSPIGRDPNNRLRMAVTPEGGKQAITHFKVVQSSVQHSWVDVSLETGRTHQIRVHMSFLGHPIVGDSLYGGREAKRIYLHAHTLYLKQPMTGLALEICSQMKLEDFQGSLSEDSV